MDLFGGQWLRDFSIEAIRKIFFVCIQRGFCRVVLIAATKSAACSITLMELAQ